MVINDNNNNYNNNLILIIIKGNNIWGINIKDTCTAQELREAVRKLIIICTCINKLSLMDIAVLFCLCHGLPPV